MIKDPKQIVTQFAFSVHPEVLGLPLATPKRRLAALIIDLLIASILTGLGNMFLAVATTILIFWIAIRTRGQNVFRNLLRYAGATFASIFVFIISYAVLESFDSSASVDTPEGIVTMQNSESIDWNEFGTKMATMDYSDPDAIEDFFEDFESLSNQNEVQNFLITIPEDFPEQLALLQSAIRLQDSVRVDSLREVLAPIIAGVEISALELTINNLDDRNEELRDENEELTDQIENPSLYVSIKKATRLMGLSLGWIGIYFISTIAFFQGQTLGKKLLNIRVIRLNNKPIGLFFAFERFGGYAAGFATGLIGFFQMFWDANRQAIHDKIAGTVVVDLRTSRLEETEAIREEILESENLLSQF